jgi:hypothetical protein
VVNAPNISLAQGALGALVASPAYGDLGAVALWLMQGSDLKRQAVPSGLSRALAIGRALRVATGDYLTVLVDTLAQVGLPARPLLGGAALTPVSFTMATVGTHDVGTLVLSNPASGDRLTVYAINENIYAYDSSSAVPASMCPDMLGWLGTDGSTFDNSQLQAAVAGGTAKPLYAVGVAAAQLIGAPSLPNRIAFRASPGIQAVMLALAGGVGYAGPYVPFEA